MLETLRKHHKIMMIVIAAIVIVAFTFLYTPGSDALGRGSDPVAKIAEEPLSGTEAELIARELSMANALSEAASQSRSPERDVVTTFGGMFFYGQTFGGITQLVDQFQPRSRDVLDLDGPVNVALMRQECRKLGIDVEREDVEKTIKTLGAFQNSGVFDDSKLNAFLDRGTYGDRAATEARLITLVRDAMLYQRLGEVVGGTFRYSPAEVDFDYAQERSRALAHTAVVERKNFEAQTITDEEIKKYYDEEKAKLDALKPEDKEPKPAADAALLTEEKRTVKYAVTTAPKAPEAPVAPIQPAAVAPLEDVSKLPEEEKKAKEEAHKKLTDEYNLKKADYDKALEAYTKASTEHGSKVEEHKKQRDAWLQRISDLSNALVSDERGTKTFDDILKQFQFESKSATFTKTTPPEDLKAAISTPPASPGQPAAKPDFDPVELIFLSDKGKDNVNGSQDQNTYCLWLVETVEAPAMRPLEEVKDKITEKLKKDKADAALKAAGDDARSKMLEALKGGKNFKDAATEAGLTANELPRFSRRTPLPAGTPNSKLITDVISGDDQKQTAGLNPGDLSDPLPVAEGLLFVYLEKKELPKDPAMDADKKTMLEQRTASGADSPVFRAWFLSRRNAAVAVQQ